MRKLFALLVFVIILPVAAFAVEPRSDIERAQAKFVAAFNAEDAAIVAKLYTDNAALFPPGEPRIEGRAAIQAFWQDAIVSGMKIDELNTDEVNARDDMAWEVGHFTLSVPNDSGPTKVVGKYIVIWKRIGDAWQLHRDIWNTH